MLTRVRRVAGLDFHVFTTLVLRTWQILAGGVMVLFIPYWLSKVEQGYYTLLDPQALRDISW